MKKMTFFLAFALIAGFISCKKEGCTDENAENFVEKANKDNGSCIYNAEIIFWYDANTAISLDSAGIDSLRVYIDSIKMVTIPASNYSILEPDCGDNGTLSFSRNMGNTPSENALYHINDQNGITLWNGTIDYIGGDCNKKELIY